MNISRIQCGGQELLQVVGSNVVVLGEVANFLAYSFAPAILVTPLGAVSVLVGYLALM